MAEQCDQEMCPMWDGDTCPCERFGLDRDDLPADGVFTVTWPTNQECVKVWPDPGHEDEGYSCVTHNCAWDECPAQTDQEETP